MADRSVSVSRTIAAGAEEIFDIIARPSMHSVIDGSGTVRGERSGVERIQGVDEKFGMRMKMWGMPYRISSTVKEFEEGRLIAWAHLGGHRWRYELEPQGDGTLVSETFDWSTAKVPKAIEVMGYPSKHPTAMEATLERLAEQVEH